MIDTDRGSVAHVGSSVGSIPLHAVVGVNTQFVPGLESHRNQGLGNSHRGVVEF